MIKCSVKETGTQEFLQRLANMKKLDMSDLAEITRKRMIGIIDEHRKRLPKVGAERYPVAPFKTHLKNSLVVTGSTNGVEISVDEKKTPYWEVLDTNPNNYVPGPVRGQFTDGLMGANNGSFAYNPEMPTMKPTKAIQPINFLEKTMVWVNQNLRKYIEKAVQDQLIGSGKFKNRLSTSKLLKNFQESS